MKDVRRVGFRLHGSGTASQYPRATQLHARSLPETGSRASQGLPFSFFGFLLLSTLAPALLGLFALVFFSLFFAVFVPAPFDAAPDVFVDRFVPLAAAADAGQRATGAVVKRRTSSAVTARTDCRSGATGTLTLDNSIGSMILYRRCSETSDKQCTRPWRSVYLPAPCAPHDASVVT